MCDSLVSAEEAIECEEIVQDTSFQALQIAELKKRNKALESKNCELSELVMLEVTEKEGIADAAEEVEKLYLERVQQQEAGEVMVASLRAELASLKESSSAQEEKMSQDRATILQLTADSSSLRAKVQLLDDMMRDACNIRDEETATPSTFVTEGDAIDETHSVPDMLESGDCSGDDESEEGDGDREGEGRKEEYDFGDDESNFSGRETAEDKQQYRLTQALGIKSARSANKPAVRRPRTLAVKERRAFRGGEAVKSTRDTYSPSFSNSPMEISPVQTQRFSRNSISPLGGPNVRGSREGSPLTTCSSIDNRRRSEGSTSSRGRSPVSSKMDSTGGVSTTASVTASAASSGSVVGSSMDRATNSCNGNSNSLTSNRLADDHQAARQRSVESLFSPSGSTVCMSDGSPGQYQFRTDVVLTELYTASQTLQEHSREDRVEEEEEEEGVGEADNESEGLAEKTLEATDQSDVLHAVKGEPVNESVFDDIPIPDMVNGPHVVQCTAPATFALAEMTPLECRSMSLDSGIFIVSNGDVSLPLLHVDADEEGEEDVSLFEAMRERESSQSSQTKPRGRGQSERNGRPDQVEEIKALLSQHLRRFEAISEDFRKTALSSLEHQRSALAIAPFSVEKEKEQEMAMEKHLLGEGNSDFLVAANAQEIALSDASTSPTLGPAVRHRPLPDSLNGATESVGSSVTTGVESRYEDHGLRMDSSQQQLQQQLKQQQQQQQVQYEQQQQMQHKQQQRQHQQQQPRSYSPRDPRPSSSPPRASNGSHFQNLKKQLAMQLESSSRTEQAALRSSGALSHSSTHPFADTSPRYHCEEKDNTHPDSARDHHRKRSDEGSTKRSLVLDLNSVRDELRGRSALSPSHTALQSNGRGRGHGSESLTLSLSKMPREEGDRYITPSMGESSFGPGTAKPKPGGDLLSEYQEYCLEMEYEKYLLHFRREQERVTKQIRLQREFFKSVNPPHSSSSSSSAYLSSFPSNVSTRTFSSPKSDVRGGDRELVDTLRVAKVALDLSQSDMHLTHQKMLELTMKVDLLQQENRNLKHLSRPPGRGPGPGMDPNSSSYSYSGSKVNYGGYSG
jgi:hypothetical protein